MEGKFTFRNIIELKNLSPLSENSAHKKNATSTRFMVQNIPVCSFDNISPISRTRIDKLVNKNKWMNNLHLLKVTPTT